MSDAESPHQPLRLGDHVRTQDGDEWTVCYWFLDGVGVVSGLQDLKGQPNDALPEPEAMLREPYKSCDLPCLGRMVEIIPKEPTP